MQSGVFTADGITEWSLIVANNWAIGTFCHWLISAGDENSYTTLEFQNIDVSYEISERHILFRIIYHTKIPDNF